MHCFWPVLSCGLCIYLVKGEGDLLASSIVIFLWVMALGSYVIMIKKKGR